MLSYTQSMRPPTGGVTLARDTGAWGRSPGETTMKMLVATLTLALSGAALGVIAASEADAAEPLRAAWAAR